VTRKLKITRVTFFRELSGTAGLSGRDLPPDEALAAMVGVNARAQQYEDSGAFGDLPMDALRAYAFTDLLKGTPAEDRIACAEAQDEAADLAEALAWADARVARNAAQTQTGHPGEPEPEPAAGTPVGPDSGRPGIPSARDRDDACSPDRAAVAAKRNDGDGGPREAGCDREADSAADRTTVRDGHPDRPDDHDSRGEPGGDDGDEGGVGDGEPGDGDGPGPGGPGPGWPGAGHPRVSPAGRAVQPRLPDLVAPLLTLLGLAERPGEVQGFGLLDPSLARSMAAAAAASPRTEVCITVTSPEGYAIGHGCARPEHRSQLAGQSGARDASSAGLPARLNLTIPAAALTGLVGRTDSTDGTGTWAFSPRACTDSPSTDSPSGTGPPDGYGTWELILPSGRRLTARLDIVPTESCDHRYESHAYHPGAKLRHLVQVRDGTCTFPSCNRHARDSDFEHAIPFEKDGRTCACNAGARSRACHRVKQTEGWTVRQPRPGWHQWTTPVGRVYTQEPKRYPA
jgi:hypothetical protein